MTEEPTHPEAKHDPLLERLNHILQAVHQHKDGLMAALNSSDAMTQLAASHRIREITGNLPETLSKDSRFTDRSGTMLSSSMASFAFFPEQASHLMVRHLLKYESAEESIRWLQKVLETNCTTGKKVELLWGAKVDNPIELDGGILIVPLSDLPRSRVTLEKNYLNTGTSPTSMATLILNSEPPSSAIVRPWRVEPLHISPDHPLDYKPHQEHNDLVSDIILTLTIIGPRIPIHCGGWFAFDDPDIEEALPATPFHGQLLEIIPNRPLSIFPTLDPNETPKRVRQFLHLTGHNQKKVRIALQRLRLALSRHSVGDRAVEIAIALETLFENGGTSEMTHKVAVRATRFLGGLQDERDRNFQIIKKNYEIRSALVHQGEVSPQKTASIQSKKLTYEEITNLAIQLCSEVIKKIMDKGCIPDWAVFDITEQPE